MKKVHGTEGLAWSLNGRITKTHRKVGAGKELKQVSFRKKGQGEETKNGGSLISKGLKKTDREGSPQKVGGGGGKNTKTFWDGKHIIGKKNLSLAIQKKLRWHKKGREGGLFASKDTLRQGMKH